MNFSSFDCAFMCEAEKLHRSGEFVPHIEFDMPWRMTTNDSTYRRATKASEFLLHVKLACIHCNRRVTVVSDVNGCECLTAKVARRWWIFAIALYIIICASYVTLNGKFTVDFSRVRRLHNANYGTWDFECKWNRLINLHWLFLHVFDARLIWLRYLLFSISSIFAYRISN